MFRYGATTLQANTWYHVAGVYNAATSDAARVPQRPARRRRARRHGHRDAAELDRQRQHRPAPDGHGFDFNGRIDDVRIYNRALTPAEIQADMNTPVAGGAGDPTAADGRDHARRRATRR